MPRPKVGDKRADIPSAAIQKIAEDGVSASTASIAKSAGVAEGSLFRYFEDKDRLLNEVYSEIKDEMRRAMASGFPAEGSLKARAEYLWNAYVNWGGQSARKRQAMAQLSVSYRITETNRKAGREGFAPITKTMKELAAKGKLSRLPSSFAQSLFLSIAETTMTSIAEDPKRAEQYRAAGFEAFWGAILGK
jgi:AcrR family transcriptional regulator